MTSTCRPAAETAARAVPRAVLDPAARYALAPGVTVAPRDATTVQIGTEASRRFLLADAPRCAPTVLAGLDGSTPLGDAVRSAGGRLAEWLPVLAELAALGLIVPATARANLAPQLRGERLTLIEQHGVAAADRLLAARSDAVVVVEGTGALAETVADLLAASGIGHVHHPRPVARAMAATVAAQGGTTAALVTTATPDEDAWGAPSRPRGQRPAVSLFPPAPQSRPTAVLLADSGGPDPGRAAELVAAVIPHLAVRTGPARVVVGPLVLPGRSACLNCVDRHRADADPDWPRVAAAGRARSADAATRAIRAAAVLAVEQILDLVDGLRRPDSVDATIEWRPGSLYPRRRPWPRHAECRCWWLARR